MQLRSTTFHSTHRGNPTGTYTYATLIESPNFITTNGIFARTQARVAGLIFQPWRSPTMTPATRQLRRSSIKITNICVTTWQYPLTVRYPPHRRQMIVVWSYRRKRRPDGTIPKYKARLCADGSQQKKGIDYEENYSAICT